MPSLKTQTKDFIKSLLDPLDIQINGHRDWDLIIHNENFFERVFKHGSLGLGEAFMDGWWDCNRLDIFFYKILRAKLESSIKLPLKFKAKTILANIINFQSKNRAYEVAKRHYNLGNSLFENMLDKRLIYSCGYFKNTDNLDLAQEAKLELICQKLQLSPGLRVLDIGCGWGGLAKYAAEKYGVEVVGITISHQQFEYAKILCKNLPVQIRFQDYRDLNDQFDRIVSVGMFEHVGAKNYAVFMQRVQRMLKDDGLFLLHTIGTHNPSPLANEWITTYIFPNGMLPSSEHITKNIEPFFVLEDWHNFGQYYDPTLMCWFKNFTHNWGKLRNQFDDRFFRMWTYYLLSCAGSFRARSIQLWQIVFTKQGLVSGYLAPR